VVRGAALFQKEFLPEQGLGPLYNARSCLACHNAPAAGGTTRDGSGAVVRVAQARADQLDLLIGQGGPIARSHSVAELGQTCALEPGIPSAANLTSVRHPPPLFGLGLVETIPDDVILAGAVPKEDGVQGRPSWVATPDGERQLGRFGWKADTPTLRLFVAAALRNELGITNPLAPVDWLPAPRDAAAPPCAGAADAPEDDGTIVTALTAYVAALPPPSPLAAAGTEPGKAIFHQVGCAACHTPRLPAAGQNLWLYSDLLLHDLGPDLDDGLPQGEAAGRDWRTTPLWGLGSRTRYLHDGRARSLDAAILAHGGEALAAREHFRALEPADREALLALLAAL
jgi:CxxC motif-containing protein (DUF1111 family)